MLEDNLDILPQVRALRERCLTILDDCQSWQQQQPIEGLHRYTNSLTAELSFIDKLLESSQLIKKEHIQSTNLSYLEAVHEALTGLTYKNEVMRLFSGPLDNTKWMPRAAMIKHHHVKVDIVSENGLVWIKVIARNAKAFRHEVMGFEWDSSSESEDEDDTRASTNDFDNLPIFKKARDYLRTAKAHHVQFQTPVVVFAFMRIQPDIFVQKIMDRLTEMGIVVHLQPGELRASYLPYLHVDDIDHIATSSLNIDVSSALAILSELSHRVCPADQVSAMPLKIQAEREAKVPCLPQILPYVSHRRLCMIQSAFERLQEIVEVVGGPNEKARFQYLFRHHFGLNLSFDPDLWTILPSLSIDIIPDASSEAFSKLLEPPADFRSKLNNGRKIRTRFSEFHAKIFGSGDHYQMTTLTAIQWMETALRDAGLQGQFSVSHEPRSLAERKMRVQA